MMDKRRGYDARIERQLEYLAQGPPSGKMAAHSVHTAAGRR